MTDDFFIFEGLFFFTSIIKYSIVMTNILGKIHFFNILFLKFYIF